jgi:hypothetical protein
MIWLSEFFMPPDPAVGRRAPVGDPNPNPSPNPLPDGAPVIDAPGREVPAIDPRRRDAPEPVREPRPDPVAEPIPR